MSSSGPEPESTERTNGLTVDEVETRVEKRGKKSGKQSNKKQSGKGSPTKSSTTNVPEKKHTKKKAAAASLLLSVSSSTAEHATARAVALLAAKNGMNAGLLSVALVAALIVHGAFGVATKKLAVPKRVQDRVEMAIVEPPPPPPPPVEEPPPEPPPEPKPVPKQKLPEPVKKELPPPPVDTPPPPSNSEPPPDDNSEPPPVVTGISMDSTTSNNSGFKVRQGNTAYGDMDKEKFVDPKDVKAYRGGSAKEFKPVRSAQVTKQARPIKKFQAKYPRQLIQQGIEGTVELKIEIAKDGTVRRVQVTKKVHPLLDRLAVEALKRSLFAPAEVDGKAVDQVITYVYRWQIPE